MLCSVRVELEVNLSDQGHVVTHADRLAARLRAQEGRTIERTSRVFHTRRGPHHGLARLTLIVQARDQGAAVSAALRALREAATGDDGAWDLARAVVTVSPERRALTRHSGQRAKRTP